MNPVPCQRGKPSLHLSPDLGERYTGCSGESAPELFPVFAFTGEHLGRNILHPFCC
jgi:hypothetical protein